MKENMEKKHIKKLEGQYCKIVTKEPGEKKASVVTGTVENIDTENGFVLIDSKQGLGALRISTIIAIKPGNIKKRHQKRSFKDQSGMVGIGTLIVFIAMILSAAVAASVILSTSQTMQQKATYIGSQTIQEVSSGVKITDLTGYTNAEKDRIEYLAINVKAQAGSKDIDLNLTMVSIKYKNITIQTLNKSLVSPVNLDNKSVFQTPIKSGSSYALIDNITKVNFGVIALHDADNSVTNTYGINTGDSVYVIVNLSAIIPQENGLPPRESISGTVQPELGSSGIFEINTPAVFTNRVIDLQ